MQYFAGRRVQKVLIRTGMAAGGTRMIAKVISPIAGISPAAMLQLHQT